MPATDIHNDHTSEVRAALALLSRDQLDHLEVMIAEERTRRDAAEDADVEAMTGDEAHKMLVAAAVADPSLMPA